MIFHFNFFCRFGHLPVILSDFFVILSDFFVILSDFFVILSVSEESDK